MNYFEFYQIPVAFILDEGALKRKFYQLSKEYHPDFHTLATPEKQEEILALSTLNNEAYETLKDADKRLYYVLQIKDAIAKEGENKLPQSFLMEMMDFNEALMELEFDNDTTKAKDLQKQLDEIKSEMYSEVAPLLESYDDANPDATALEQIKNYYFKQKYLLRIQENLDKFAV